MSVTPPDSAALRSHGATLRATAESIRAVAGRLNYRIDGTDYRGPAADRFRAVMDDRIERMRVTARELDDLAEIVVLDTGGPTA